MALVIDKWMSLSTMYPWSRKYWFDTIERTMISEQELYAKYCDRGPCTQLFLSKEYIPVEGVPVVQLQKNFVKIHECKELEARLNGLHGIEYYNAFMEYIDNSSMEHEYRCCLADAAQIAIIHWIDKYDIANCSVLIRFKAKKSRGADSGYFEEVKEILAAEEREEREYRAGMPERMD